MMPEPATNCPYGDESDIDARYLAGTLSPAESDVFEEHYFFCDKCFARVQRGNEIAAALGAPSDSLRSSRKESSTFSDAPIPIGDRRRFSGWRPVLTAAALVIVALGIRQVVRPRASTPPAVTASSATPSRGGAPVLSLAATATPNTIVATWSSTPAARSYRVRLLSSDGSLLFTGETADTSITVSRDLLRAAADKTTAYWDVQALDALRVVVAASPIVHVKISSSSQ